MPYASADGVKLYYEECGKGLPVILVHEFAGDMRSWEPQVRFLARRYRCITYNARGYPPSDVPPDPAAYSQDLATDDIAHVLRHLGINRAHVVGFSMGAFAALHFGLRHPGMALSVAVIAGGYGTRPDQRRRFAADSEDLADRLEAEGSKAVAQWYAEGAYRVQLRDKNPRAWAEFRERLAEHSATGTAPTMRGVQAAPPVVLGPRGGAAADEADRPPRHRLRGRLVPRVHLPQAHHPDGGSVDGA